MESSDRERQYIVNYMASQAGNETVEHLEKVAAERVLGRGIDVWDVHRHQPLVGYYRAR